MNRFLIVFHKHESLSRITLFVQHTSLTSTLAWKSIIDFIFSSILLSAFIEIRVIAHILLQGHKQKLRVWNTAVFGKVETKLKDAEEEAHAIELIAEDRPLLGNEQARRKELMGEIWRLNKMLERIWLQKSRVSWATQGDRNTRHFHIMACNRNSRNSLCSVLVNGSMVEELLKVRLEVKKHFMNHFSENWVVRPKLVGQFKHIGDSPAVDLLEAEFTEEEVSHVIKSCEGNKAPRPDGFNLAFFKKYWGIVKSEIMQFFSEFHQNATLSYRSLYKILAEVLANRMKQVMPRIISESQSAFLRGRNILDGILIANEVVDGWRKSNKKGLVLKLDFEKAYDSSIGNSCLMCVPISDLVKDG
ncbi:uncharacterized protein LOC114305951 [Camellia sinensis]|uniref:uncharacterized protein LOC114305951 n=1 Tax=Camellia sinensis TaxID=4442 RepID=UPI001035BB55|nr:uncharacterized protein LOC114305951 [Camellia sinensis]